MSAKAKTIDQPVIGHFTSSVRHHRHSCTQRPPVKSDLKEELATDGGTSQGAAQKADERFMRILFAIRDMRLDKDFEDALSLVQGLEQQLRQEQLEMRQNEAGVVTA